MKLFGILQRPPAIFLAATHLLVACGGEPAELRAPTATPTQRARVASLAFRPALGQVRHYAVTLNGNSKVAVSTLATLVSPGAKAASPTHNDYRYGLTASVSFRVVAKDGVDWLVAGRITSAQMLIDGVDDGSAARLNVPFVFRMGERGEMREFQFPMHYAPDAAATVLSLVQPLQTVLPSAPSSSWTVGENAQAGHSTVRYGVRDEADGVTTLEREVTAAHRTVMLGGAADAPQRFRTTVEQSGGEVQLDDTGAAILVHTTESTTTYSANDLVAANTQTYHAALSGSASTTTLPTSVEEATAALTDVSFARSAFYRVPTSIAAQLKGATLEDIEKLFVAHVGKTSRERSDVMLLTYMYLRQHPADVAAFARMLDGHAQKAADNLTDEVMDLVGFGFAALGAAGHEEAQQQLVRVLDEPAWTFLSKKKAVDALMSVEMPERFVPRSLWAFRERLPKHDSAVAFEALSIATNVYGYLGRVNAGVVENTKEVTQTLSRLLDSGDALEVRRALVALGNIGESDLVLPLTSRFLTDPSEQIRERAFDGFRGDDSEAAFVRFAQAYDAETSPWVKREASEVAFSMGESQARTAWAAQQIEASSDGIIQGRAVEILGRGLTAHPENADTLRGLLSVVKDREVRRAIYRFTGPQNALSQRGAK